MKKTGLSLIFLFVILINGFSQVEKSDSSFSIIEDTLQVKPTVVSTDRHSPTKATLLSVALPGLGQAYNRKYWKIPIIYGLAGTTVYLAITNYKKWKPFSDAYRYRIDGDSTTIDDYATEYSANNLLDLKKYYKRSLDLSIIFTFVVYAINIVDAAVDGHFFKFDVSDDLSLYIDPVINITANKNNQYYGFRINLRL